MKSIRAHFITLFYSLLAFSGIGVAFGSEDRRAPDVPESLQVPEGNKVSFRAFAIGVQIYTAAPSPADPTKLVWNFTAPRAVLFDADGAVVGIHYAYAGPTRPAWESESGGIVVGMRTVPPVTVDPTAIPWLRLETAHVEGPGIFKRTTFIHRINTTGGLAPAVAPAYVGQEARISYTAEYVFYRAHK